MPQRAAYADKADELREMLARTNILAVYERATGLSSNGPRAGRNILVHCPTRSHQDKHQSCSLDPQKNAFHSFCCDVPGSRGKNGGGILDLIIFAGKSATRGEAARWLRDSGLVGYEFDYRNSAPLEVVRDRAGHSRVPRDARVARRFDYRSKKRELLYRVERLEWPNPDYDPTNENSKPMEKSFRQLHATTIGDDHCKTCTIMLRDEIQGIRASERSWRQISARYGLTGDIPERQDIAQLQSAGHADPRRIAGSEHVCEQKICATCTTALQGELRRGFRTWKPLEWKFGLNREQITAMKEGAAPNVRAHPNVLRWGTEGIERVPYNLPAVCDAAAAGKIIHQVEGEKKVHALEWIGEIASTQMGGARSPMPAAWAEYFRGAECVAVMPDCDDPGREAALARLRVFQRAGIPAFIFDIAPQRNDKYDIDDWVVEWKRDHPRVGPEVVRADFEKMREFALEQHRLEQVLVVNAPQLSPRDSTKHVFVHADSDEALRLLRFVPFAGAYVGPGTDAPKLVDAIVANGAPVVRFDPLARAAQLHYRKLIHPEITSSEPKLRAAAL
jgi:hypothetical protein